MNKIKSKLFTHILLNSDLDAEQRFIFLKDFITNDHEIEKELAISKFKNKNSKEAIYFYLKFNSNNFNKLLNSQNEEEKIDIENVIEVLSIMNKIIYQEFLMVQMLITKADLGTLAKKLNEVDFSSITNINKIKVKQDILEKLIELKEIKKINNEVSPRLDYIEILFDKLENKDIVVKNNFKNINKLEKVREHFIKNQDIYWNDLIKPDYQNVLAVNELQNSINQNNLIDFLDNAKLKLIISFIEKESNAQKIADAINNKYQFKHLIDIKNKLISQAAALNMDFKDDSYAGNLNLSLTPKALKYAKTFDGRWKFNNEFFAGYDKELRDFTLRHKNDFENELFLNIFSFLYQKGNIEYIQIAEADDLSSKIIVEDINNTNFLSTTIKEKVGEVKTKITDLKSKATDIKFVFDDKQTITQWEEGLKNAKLSIAKINKRSALFGLEDIKYLTEVKDREKEIDSTLSSYKEEIESSWQSAKSLIEKLKKVSGIEPTDILPPKKEFISKSGYEENRKKLTTFITNLNDKIKESETSLKTYKDQITLMYKKYSENTPVIPENANSAKEMLDSLTKDVEAEKDFIGKYYEYVEGDHVHLLKMSRKKQIRIAKEKQEKEKQEKEKQEKEKQEKERLSKEEKTTERQE